MMLKVNIHRIKITSLTNIIEKL